MFKIAQFFFWFALLTFILYTLWGPYSIGLSRGVEGFGSVKAWGVFEYYVVERYRRSPDATSSMEVRLDGKRLAVTVLCTIQIFLIANRRLTKDSTRKAADMHGMNISD